MFRRKAKPDEHAAAASKAADKGKKLTTAVESTTEDTGESGNAKESVEETQPSHPPSPEQKPQSSSWWSLLTNPSLVSLVNTAMADASADPMKPLDREALMKTMKDKKADMPEQQQQLMAALEAQQNATGLLARASALKDKAMKAMNPAERQKMMQEAYDSEVAANGQSKTARRMQSGPWQGGVGGAGIGGGVGMGLGTVVGAVVGGVVSLPTTALGGLVGAGVGGIHGPFVKLNQKKAKEVEEREKAKGKSDEEVAEAVREEAVEEMEGDEAESVHGEDVEAPAAAGAAISQPETGSAKRNLERHHSTGKVPTQDATPTHSATRDPNKPRKKPKKLEVRSGNKSTPTVQTSASKAGKENDANGKG